MSQRVEELLHDLGLLNRPKKPRIIEGETAARFHWRLLRNCIRNVSDEVAKQDRRDYHVSHGIQFYRKINHTHPIRQVLYLRTKDEYVTLDGEYIRTFKGDGRKVDLIGHDIPFMQLVYVDHVNQFIGWTPNTTTLYVLSDSFEVITESTSERGLVHVMYNEDTGDIVTAEPGRLTTWVFRYGNRHLLPHRFTTDGLEEDRVLELMVLERTASHSQRLFAVVDKGMRVFNLHLCKCVNKHEEMHTREITATTFFNPLKFLISAARDGSIKVWSTEFSLKMVFVGHHERVHRLDVYPFGPMIMSISSDKTLRVWSLEMSDEVDKVSLDTEALDIGAVIGRDSFHTVSEMCVDLWRINQLHLHHTSTAGADIISIKVTDHPSFPVRGVLLCKDAYVHIISPATGEVLTTAVCPRPNRTRLVDAAYAIEEDVLFVVYNDGFMAKFSTASNPCRLLAQWPITDQKSQVNYLLVYEYVISAASGWSSFKKALATRAIAEEEDDDEGGVASAKKEKRNKTLLLGGRKDGYICVYNWNTGDIDYKVEAHGSKGVLSMVANSSHDQLISAGKDNIIKVWRMYPFADESLAPLMSFFCAHLPLCMSVFKQNLMVAFQEPRTATYSVVLYNLESKNRFDHSPDDDHIDNFSGISCCSRLKIFVTASMDGTLRVWNESNHLIRVLHLHYVPQSVGFCSERGDILIGIGAHLYFIDHNKYLPKAYLRKMVMMMFKEPGPAEHPQPYDETIMGEIGPEAAKHVSLARASFKFHNYADVLSEAEHELLSAEQTLKKTAFALLAEREKELRLIRDGEMVAVRKPKPTKYTRAHAFNRYLRTFYDRPKLHVPREPCLKDDAQALYEENAGQTKRRTSSVEREKYRPEDPEGFFPPISEAVRAPQEEEVPHPVGYLPNSVLLKLLFPGEVLKTQLDTWRPPDFSQDQLEQITEASKAAKKKRKAKAAEREASKVSFAMSSEDEEEVRFFDWGDEEAEVSGETDAATPEAKEEEEEEEPLVLFELASDRKRKAEEEEEKAKEAGKSDFMQRMQSLIEKPPTPRTPEEPSPPPPPPKKLADKPPRKAISREELMARRPPPGPSRGDSDETPVSASRPRPPPTRRTASRPGPSSTPLSTPASRQTAIQERPKTPLPDYVRQFVGQTWFDSRFPRPATRDFPQPLTPSAFCSAVVSLMREAGWGEKCQIIQAVLTLHQGESIAGHCLQATKHNILAGMDECPSLIVSEERRFIESGLKTLVSMEMRDRDVISEILLWHFDGDDGLSLIVNNILAHIGKDDPHNYFNRELDSWDLLGVSVDYGLQRRRDLRKIIEAWLDKWLSSFKIHVRDAVDKLRKGEEVSGKLDRGRSRSSGKSGGILKKGRKSGQEESPISNAESASGALGRILTVTFETAPDPSVAETATYIDAINYFCEVCHEKKLAKLRSPGRARRRQEEMTAATADGEPEDVKNTVLVLPHLPSRRQCLVRLGESHTDAVPRRRTDENALRLTHDYSQPAAMQPAVGYKRAMTGDFVPYLHLPLKPCLLSPFPSEWDVREWDSAHGGPVTVRMRCTQKFFVPSMSYVHPA